jgi:SOS response regulatory protein OraA/RecX
LENLQNERNFPEDNPIDSEQNNTKGPTKIFRTQVDKEVQNNQQEEEEKEQTSEQSILMTQQMVSKDGQPSKYADKRRKKKSPMITIKMT